MPYGVRRGRQAGVYNTWEECKEQVDRYPNASFKKLPTHSEARNYVRSHETSSPYSSAGRSAQVYTDGCCSRNGQYGANGGIGVYWGPGDSRNVSAKLEGRQTNQRAEIEAARTAVKQARDDNITSLQINTDSKFTINGMTQWVPKWKENGWKTVDGRDVINKQDFQKLDKACENMDIRWNYVPGHSGSVGNDRADQLAKAGSRK
ncbi:uncharacterized protein LOC779807 [Xenopus tropicalis]|uniref:Ribonuclease H1 n=1 Tax=Xenopus tropicalis TaxID=8364 RepID=Q0V9P2_XENTR|eukprot:XP_012818597.1 PREDICTED: uncharacterized protein LOC779807 isoform X1 [Xenopus tropicalis]